jgi:anti-sigma factor RsiW
MNTGCEFFEDALVDHAAGRLTGEPARAVAEHLDVCADCRALLGAVQTVRRADVVVPEDLEARIRIAVHGVLDDAARQPRREAPRPTRKILPWRGRSPRVTSRPRWLLPLTLPLTAAAALALVWVGIGEYQDGDPGARGGSVDAAVAVEDYAPYGAWPASDMVAGDPLLSELSNEDLERLLEEMES